MLEKRDVQYTDDIIGSIRELVERYQAITSTQLIFREASMKQYLGRNRDFRHCRALPFWGYISSQGDFYTCSVYLQDDRFKVGNIYSENMADIFNGPRRCSSIEYGENCLDISGECRVNCRMARINEYLEDLSVAPEHVNFI